MEFEINNDIWKVVEKDKEEMLHTYKQNNDDDSNFIFGITIYPEHVIWINKDMCKSQKIKTLKHELTHCYIYNSGLYNVPNFNEEMACDLVACSNNFINEVVDKYKKEILNK